MKKLFFFIALTLHMACSAPDEKQAAATKFDIEAARAYIHQANKTYDERFRTNDENWYSNLYCTDACTMPEGTAKICGVSNIIKQYYNDGLNKDFKLVITAQNIFGHSDILVEEGIYDFTDSTGTVLDTGKFIALWKEENGKLKMYREIWTTNLRRE